MMAEKFDVLTQGWIPVVDREETIRKVGILEALKNSHNFVGISDPSPMVEYGLYRFLSVFLMDALRPEEQGALEDLLEQGAFDGEMIDSYVKQCRGEGVSFDLFDKERPFLQTPYVSQVDKKGKMVEDRKPAAALDYSCPSGDSHAHFDHRDVGEITFSFDEAARLLVPLQIFSPAGGRGYPYNVNGQPPFYTIVKGKTLFETLVFSMRPLSQIDIPFDSPKVFWRNPSLLESGKLVASTSWLYGMIFPARKITLFPEKGMVTKIYLAPGLKFASETMWRDPFVTYQLEKGEFKPWRPNREIAVWRNLSDLADTEGKKEPQVLQQYFELEKDSEEAAISVYGAQTVPGKATFLDEFHFDLKFPVRLAKNEMFLNIVTCAIRSAEKMEGVLKSTFDDISEYPKAPCQKRHLNEEAPKIPGISRAVVREASRRYYDRCEQQFWNLCENNGETLEELEKAYLAWCDYLAETAQSIRNEVLAQSHLTGRALAKAAAHDKDIPDANRLNKKEAEKWIKA